MHITGEMILFCCHKILAKSWKLKTVDNKFGYIFKRGAKWCARGLAIRYWGGLAQYPSSSSAYLSKAYIFIRRILWRELILNGSLSFPYKPNGGSICKKGNLHFAALLEIRWMAQVYIDVEYERFYGRIGYLRPGLWEKYKEVWNWWLILIWTFLTLGSCLR